MNLDLPFSAPLHEALAFSDKFILASNLQKCIRRGYTTAACDSAARLLAIDDTYLWRRLQIIALEDISLGDVSLCRQVVAAGSSKRLREQRDPAELLQQLVADMCGAIKSRTACDALTLLDALEDHLPIAHLLGLPAGQLIDIVVDRSGDLPIRIAALRILSGWTRFTNGRYETLHRPDSQAMRAICREFDLSDELTELVLAGRNSAGLAGMLPLVQSTSMSIPSTFLTYLDEVETTSEEHVYVRNFALDMYTRVGRQCFATMLKQYPELSSELRVIAPKARLIDLLGIGYFQTESSLLDVQLRWPFADMLKQRAETAELVKAGIGDTRRHTGFRALLAEYAPALASTRNQAKTMLGL